MALLDHAEVEARAAVQTTSAGMRGSLVRIPGRQQVTLGWVTSNRAVPIRYCLRTVTMISRPARKGSGTAPV